MGSGFCNVCGASASSVGPPPYTPRYLVEKILGSRGALEGERKQITVLFADMRGSLELIASRDPEEAQSILDPVLERMMEAVHHYEGVVSEARGDGIMALFGAPLAHEDHAVRACYAALRMQDSVRRLAAEIRGRCGVEVAIRVGLNSGEVVVRSIGSDLRMDYTAIGETTHLAGRMEQLAAPGTIYLTAETLRLVEGSVEVKPLGPLAVKGLKQPIEAYEAIGPGSARTRFHAATARGLVRFVGRDAELSELERAFEHAGDGRGRFMAVLGEPGVGKSRLLHEVTRSAPARGWRLLECGGVSYGKGASYLPIVELLKAHFHIGHGDDHATIREKVSGKVRGLDGALEPALTPLLALLDVPVDSQWKALDPAERRRRTINAVRSLLLCESEHHPLVLVFEDLQWIDAETQAVLDHLIASVPAARVLLLVSYRPEYQQSGAAARHCATIRLEPLATPSAKELLGALLGEESSVAPLKRLLLERAGGNPLFLEECVRSLAENGTLTGGLGAYRLVASLHSLDVPASVQAILASRIDRLPHDEKHHLQVAAVIGENVPLTLLREVLGNGERLRQGLATLQTAELLYEARLFPDVEYAFKHALTRDVAYRSVLRDRRRGLHVGVLEAIERIHAARLAEHFERLAHHATLGESWEKAVHYSHRSARKAGARSAYREAAASYDQALRALSHMPESRATHERAVDLHFELLYMLAPLGETSHALKLLAAAEPIAEALGDRGRLARLLAQKGIVLWAQGRSTEARECGRRSRDIAVALGDRGPQMNASYVLGMAEYTLGIFPAAIAALGAGLRILKDEPRSERFRIFHSVGLRVGLALSLAQLGRLREALENANDAVQIAEAEGDSFDLASALSALGFVQFHRGELETAMGILQRGRDVAERAALIVTLMALTADLGRTYAWSGRADEGAALLEETLRRAGGEIQIYAGDWRAYLGEARLRAGRRDDARRAAEDALRFSRERGQHGAEALSLHVLGEIAASESSTTEEAEAHLREAMARAGDLGMRLLQARAQLALGEVERRAGERLEARRNLDQAAARFREIDVPYWTARAEAAARATAC